MTNAENLTDPAQRAAALSQVSSDFNTANTALNQQLQYAQSGLQVWSANDSTGNAQVAPGKRGIYSQDITGIQNIQGQLNQLQSNFTSNYNPNLATTGYTPAQINQLVAQTPGYQFQYTQGLNALQAQQAAAGNSNSGNAMVAAENYGQQAAMTGFQQYIGNLATESGIAQPLVQQGITQTSTNTNTNNQVQLQSLLAGFNAQNNLAAQNTQLQNASNQIRAQQGNPLGGLLGMTFGNGLSQVGTSLIKSIGGF
jgi:hypothetical protein